MGYFDFQKKSDCIVCIDSDGCAMDTMEVKHRTCFGPQWIKTFGLTEHEAECMELWLSINLYSITRGINRFKGLALALAEVEKRGLGNIEGLAEYEAWTKEAKELSNPALLAVTQKSDNPCFEKALLWSIRTNRAIHALPAEDRPFPNVKSAMDAMAKQADLAAVVAIASSYLDKPVPGTMAAVGEVGLSGEIRSITHMEQRLSEVRRLGFTQCMVPAHKIKDLKSPAGLELLPVANISGALRLLAQGK